MNEQVSLATVFWGEKFRRYFLDYCLSSLLAPGNIPILNRRDGSVFLICTTQEDWAAMQGHHAFTILSSYIKPVHLDLSAEQPNVSKMARMSQGHLELSSALYERRTYGMFVYPDTIFSSNVISHALKIMEGGKSVVLAYCPRFANNNILSLLDQKKTSKKPGVIDVTASELYGMSITHSHSEHLVTEWIKPYFDQNSPGEIFWTVERGDEQLVHSLQWAPLMLDYASLKRHEVTTLVEWTIDGDYIYRNFGGGHEIYAEYDGSQIALVSFTPESEVTRLPFVKHPDSRLLTKFWDVNKWLYSPSIDELKRELFKKPVRITVKRRQWKWILTRVRTAPLIAVCLAPPPLIDALFRSRNLIRSVIGDLVRFRVGPIKIWRSFLPPEAFVAGDIFNDFHFSHDEGVGIEKSITSPRLLDSGKWYWEVKLESGIDPALLPLAFVGVVSHESGKKGTIGFRLDRIVVRTKDMHANGSATEKGVLMLAADIEARSLWFGINGHWIDQSLPGDPNRVLLPLPLNAVRPAMSIRHGDKGTPTLTLCATEASWNYKAPDGYLPITAAPAHSQRNLRIETFFANLLSAFFVPIQLVLSIFYFAFRVTRFCLRRAKRFYGRFF
jgi:hypothetical protein